MNVVERGLSMKGFFHSKFENDKGRNYYNN